jgi:type II secretory ATPase GspE/PulE/Tfp pilus assembly ATPase PilB-like protein
VKRKSADITARMSRSEVAEAQAKARAAAFVWPAPPYYEFSDPAAAADGADCLLMFRDGRKVSGVLVSFFPEAQQLRFRAEDAGESVSLPFAVLFGVQLRRPVEIRRPALRPDDTAQLYSPAERQPFAMRLTNRNAFRGETVGSVHALCGVFLYPPDRDGTVTRWFIPADATESASIGKPIGEMLVEEKLASPEAVDAALSRQKALRSRRFGQYLTDNQIVSPEQLAAALKHQRSQPIQKLGETLVELGYLTESELDEALAIEARDRTVPLGQILADMGVVEAEVVNAVIARKLGIPYISLRTFRIPPEVLKRIPAAVAQRFQTLPVAEADNALAVAIENPMDMAKLEELRFVVGSKLLPVMASGEDIRAALEKAYGDARALAPAEVRKRIDVGIGELTHRLAAETADAAIDESQSVEQDNTLVQLVNKMIIDAAEQKASDIHIEANPGGKDMRVRFRKDGALVTYLDLPARFRKAVVSRLKIMAQLDITERRKPQDGKIEFRRFGPLDVDLRMATIPTTGGLEDIVMRVLTAANPVALDALGFDSGQLQALKRLISRPHGLFLVCGPTGAGKTTTLHSLLRELNTAELKIWTAEDPIEIVQAGLRQVQVNPKIGWTFAAAMRSFMRADPDVIMVGEMRDAETAKTGIEASLTGHLVFSTLHTNSAVESVVRLLDLDMDPFNFADALLGVLAQRLVRKLCADCKVTYAPSGAELEELASESRVVPPKRLLYRAKGCVRCDRTGYRGRMAVYELLVADAAVKRLMQRRAPVSEIAAAAGASGLRTLKQSALDKVIEGHTDLPQVRAITS